LAAKKLISIHVGWVGIPERIAVMWTTWNDEAAD
jgi:hypothetical protein